MLPKTLFPILWPYFIPRLNNETFAEGWVCWNVCLTCMRAALILYVDPSGRSGSSLSLPRYFSINFLYRIQHPPPPHSQVQPQEHQPPCQESSALAPLLICAPQLPLRVPSQFSISFFLHGLNPFTSAMTRELVRLQCPQLRLFHWNCLFVGYVLNL